MGGPPVFAALCWHLLMVNALVCEPPEPIDGLSRNDLTFLESTLSAKDAPKIPFKMSKAFYVQDTDKDWRAVPKAMELLSAIKGLCAGAPPAKE